MRTLATTSLLKHKWLKISLFLLLLALLSTGAFLRFYKISNQSYWMDEGYTINAVLSIVDHGNTILDSGKYYSCPLYCYPTATISKLFGDNAFSYRFLSALAGIFLIIIIFITTRLLFNKHASYLASFFVTFSYFQIAWSRQARWYTLFSLFFWLSLFFFYKSLYADKKPVYIIATAFFTTLSIATHGLGYLLPFIFIIWIILDKVFLQKERKLRNLKKTFFAIIGLIFLILFIDTFVKINFFTDLMKNINFSYQLPYYLSFYLRNYWLWILFGTFAIFDRQNIYKKQTYFLLIVFATYLIPLSFLTNIVHYRYLFHLTPAIYILGAVGMLNVYRPLPKAFYKFSLAGIVVFIFFFSNAGVVFPKQAYYLESDNPETLSGRPHYAYTPQPDWNSAYAHIRKNKKTDDIVISSMPQFTKIFLNEPGYWIKYNYLGFTDKSSKIYNGKEYYVGAEVISDVNELKTLVNNTHGYIIFDYMALDGKIPEEIISFIQENTEEVFYKNTNYYSQVWVYEF